MTLRSDIRTIKNAQSGTDGITTFPTGAAAANGVSTAEVLRYTQENVNNGGTALPSGDSLYGVLAGASGITTFPAAAVPANNVSLAEVSRYICETQLAAANASQPRLATAASASPLTTANLFTYTGTIEIMAIVGRVTTVVQAQATTTKLSVVSDALSAYDLCTTVDLTAAAVGTLLSITGTAANAMVATASGVLAPTQASRIIATCTTSGVIKVTYGAASTGAISWFLQWRPISAGATVT